MIWIQSKNLSENYQFHLEDKHSNIRSLKNRLKDTKLYLEKNKILKDN